MDANFHLVVFLVVSPLISWCAGAMLEAKTNFSDVGKPRTFELQGRARQIYKELTR